MYIKQAVHLICTFNSARSACCSSLASFHIRSSRYLSAAPLPLSWKTAKDGFVFNAYALGWKPQQHCQHLAFPSSQVSPVHSITVSPWNENLLNSIIMGFYYNMNKGKENQFDPTCLYWEQKHSRVCDFLFVKVLLDSALVHLKTDLVKTLGQFSVEYAFCMHWKSEWWGKEGYFLTFV